MAESWQLALTGRGIGLGAAAELKKTASLAARVFS